MRKIENEQFVIVFFSIEKEDEYSISIALPHPTKVFVETTPDVELVIETLAWVLEEILVFTHDITLIDGVAHDDISMFEQ